MPLPPIPEKKTCIAIGYRGCGRGSRPDIIKLMKKISRIFTRLPIGILLVLTLLTGLVSVLALRHNNQTMVQLRTAVYAADKNNSNVDAALNKLRDYVYGHMNTDLSSGNNNIKPPIQLKYTYERLTQGQENQLQVNNSKVFTDAQAYCQSVGDAGFDTACVQNYVVNHGGAQTNANVPAGLYEFDFVSPTWSPDLAGWSLLATILLAIVFVIRLAVSLLKRL